MGVHGFMDEYRQGTAPAAFPKTRVWRSAVAFDLKPHRRSVELGRIRALRRGHASSALDWLCDLADRHEVRVQGFIEPFAEKWLTHEQLVRWYRRHGFEVTRSEGYDYIEHQRRAECRDSLHRSTERISPGLRIASSIRKNARSLTKPWSRMTQRAWRRR